MTGPIIRNPMAELYALRSAGDDSAAVEFFDDRVIYHDQVQPLTLHGRDEVIAFYASARARFDSLAFAVVMAVADDAHFACEVRMSGVVRESGRVFDLPYAVVGDLRGGLITRVVEYYERSHFVRTEERPRPPTPRK